MTQQARRNRTHTATTDNSDVPNQAEEPNPFVANAQSFSPYSESISALATALPMMEVTQELTIGGNAETLDYEDQTLYTADRIPVQVRTPWMVTRIAMASSSRKPPSPTATTLFGQLLSRSALEQIQIPEGQEDKEQAEGEHQDGEENPTDAKELIDHEGPEGGDGPGGPGGGGPGGPGGLGGPGGPGGGGSRGLISPRSVKVVQP
ncbi:hypothetical protein F5050DRAFT_1812899 [Lentinula boryana]|uniref:Uncharacterized protein n=1 Tax=Lentinula boryana TaxID=40481 RepID=A0ABQ8PXM4_9AGAR|nr:hypothetical protein F5050DRAFT_1812899 [Lentinula boryana]